ncbi:hypothetical protein [Klebsiella pneumoniae]|uniref:hypothetical protein n=1 Tax=Klebsiella pneumoniae TaxID=573 RepID=UPI00115B4CEC|nr:hypothetical protein [Klebsiella pneumoniae]
MMNIEVGDTVKSIHTGNKFIVEYISTDGFFFILVYKYQDNVNGPKTRGYDIHDIRRSFLKEE